MTRLHSIFRIFLLVGLLSGCSNYSFVTDRESLNNNNDDRDSQLISIQIESSEELIEPKVEQTVQNIPMCGETLGDVTTECIILKDSFERESVVQTNNGPGFGWMTVIDDVLGANGERVHADIYSESEMGPNPGSITDVLPDLGRSLWFSGRKGGSVHTVYLISRPIDLTGYNSVMVGFQYLPVDLETWSWKTANGIESVRLEVCDASMENCGIGNQPDEDKLNSNAWKTFPESSQGEGAGLSGHNHSLTDWRAANANIDLNSLSVASRSEFVFRIAVTVDEGFMEYDQNNNPILSSDMFDGVAVDNVIAMASKQIVDDSHQCTDLPTDDDCTDCGNNPDGNNPDGNNPDGNNPDGNNPDGNNPDGNNPDGNNPDGNNPDGNNPDGNNPDGNNPDGNNPDGNEPPLDCNFPEDYDSQGGLDPRLRACAGDKD